MYGEEEGGGASLTTDPAAGSSTGTDVSLKEHMLVRVRYESQITKFLVGFVLAVGAFAWAMIQRRLEILNHENARIASVTENTVSSDTYKSDESRRSAERDKLDVWRQQVDSDRTQTITRSEYQRETKQDSRAGITVTTAVVGVFLTLAAIIITSLSIYLATHDTPKVEVPTVTLTETTSR